MNMLCEKIRFVIGDKGKRCLLKNKEVLEKKRGISG
jgi:hypothetical protein